MDKVFSPSHAGRPIRNTSTDVGRITLLRAVTADFASYLVKSDDSEKEMVATLLEELVELRQELNGGD